MDPIKLFIRRPIFTAMLLLALVVFGLFSWPKMGVDMMPDMDIPVVTVVTVLPGADPETIEKDVTEPLEEVRRRAALLPENSRRWSFETAIKRDISEKALQRQWKTSIP
mgnify:CR=1 FL=1